MEAAFAWTEDRIAVLTKMISQNYPARVIAERLGTSRNAVLGKSNRMGISMVKPKSTPNVRKPKIKKASPLPRAPQQPRVYREVLRIVPANIHGGMRIVRAVEADQPALRCVEIEPRHLSLIDLEPGDCRYPYGDGPMTFCGHPKHAESSYCFQHFHLCREELRPRTDKRYSRAAA